MIIKDFFKTRKDGVNLYRTYSDEQKKILQNETGKTYSSAIDVENAPYTYSETDEPIEVKETDMTELTEKAKAYDILTGVEV